MVNFMTNIVALQFDIADIRFKNFPLGIESFDPKGFYSLTLFFITSRSEYR